MARRTGRRLRRQRSTGGLANPRARPELGQGVTALATVGVKVVQHNKTALVTGASRGIGRATALALAETGAHVLVHYGPLCARSGISRLPDPNERETRKRNLGGSRNSERRYAATRTVALNSRRSIGCACAQRRNQQGGTHRGLYGRGF